MANNSCNTSATKQYFIIVPKLHVLGANISGNIFNTVDTVEKEINSIKHSLYSNIVLHVNTDPKNDAFNTQDSKSLYANGNESNWQKANSTFISEMSYTNIAKSTQYDEMSYLNKLTMTKGFYDIPSDNILDFGIIKNRRTGSYEYCLIDEGSEKSNYTLESKLITFYSYNYDGSVSEESDKRIYPHALIGQTINFANLNEKRVTDFSTYSLDDSQCSSDNPVWTWGIHTLKDLNPNAYILEYTMNTMYNFFICGTKINNGSADVYEDSTYPLIYSAENSEYSLYNFPGSNESLHYWPQASENICAINSGWTDSTPIRPSTSASFWRYYIPGTNYCTVSAGQSYNHQFQWRFVGNLLSDANAFTSQLGHNHTGRTVRMPEVRTDLNNATITYLNGNGVETSYSDTPHSYSKQTNRFSYKYDNGNLVKRVPLKSGVSNKIFNTNPSDPTSAGFNSNEGLLHDRDVILVNKGIGPDYSISNHRGTYSTNPQSWSFSNTYWPQEIEFELFYCANINNPFASQNLLNFGRKLNALTSNFNTGILKETVPNKLFYDYSNPNENDFVHIQQLKDYSNSSIVYGCTWELPNSAQNCNAFSNLLNNASWTATQPKLTNVIPTVEIKNVYIWEKCGTPYFGSTTLKGKKQTTGANAGHYTYGEYYLAYFAHNLYLIDKQTFDEYFYTAQEFMDLADDLIDPSNTGHNSVTTAMAPFTTNGTTELPNGVSLSSYNRIGRYSNL